MGWGDWANLAVQAYGAYSSSKAQKDAAKDAGKATQQGTDASNKLIWDMFQQNRADQKPFYDTGVEAQGQYKNAMGMGQPDGTDQYARRAYVLANPDVAAAGVDPWSHFQNYGQGESRTWGGGDALTLRLRDQPGYEFGMNEGLRGVQASAAARGGLNSGATLKSLFKYGNDYADQQAFTPYMNRLSGLFGGAQTAAGQMGGYGQNAANQMGNNTMAGAYARAQSTYAAGQARSQMINDFGYGLNKYGTQQGWWG